MNTTPQTLFSTIKLETQSAIDRAIEETLLSHRGVAQIARYTELWHQSDRAGQFEPNTTPWTKYCSTYATNWHRNEKHYIPGWNFLCPGIRRATRRNSRNSPSGSDGRTTRYPRRTPGLPLHNQRRGLDICRCKGMGFSGRYAPHRPGNHRPSNRAGRMGSPVWGRSECRSSCIWAIYGTNRGSGNRPTGPPIIRSFRYRNMGRILPTLNP